MASRISNKTIWSDAALYGLVLGIVTIGFSLLHTLAAKVSGIAGGFLGTGLWILKFAGCILLFRYFLQRFAKNRPEAEYEDTKTLGLAVALTSALIVAAYGLADALYIHPEAMQEAMDAAMASYSSMLTSDQMDMMGNMTGSMPVISFFTMLIYCFLFGLVLTFIFAPKITPKKSIFDEPDAQQ